MTQILIIEDDPYVQRVYARLFSHRKYTFQMVDNGIDGVKKAKSLNPDLILLDIMMNPMNGMDVLEKLKKNKSTASIPVVMLTNIGEDEYVKKAHALGAAGYMIKSDFEPDDIVKQVNIYLQKTASKVR